MVTGWKQITDRSGNVGTKVLTVIVEAPPKSEKPTNYYLDKTVIPYIYN